MKKFITLVLVAIVALSCLLFTACVPNDVENAQLKMKEEGYVVVDYSVEKDSCVGGILATRNLVDSLYALCFDSVGSAKEYYQGLADKSKAIQKGKWVYWGTEDAIEDFAD